MLSPMIRATATDKTSDGWRQAETQAVVSLLAADSPAGLEARCATQPAEAQDGKAPEWIHLLPNEQATTVDGRGPYTIPDNAAVIAASLHDTGRLVIDENHATDLAAPQGLSAPARGWIVGLEARADGIWGKVEWTDAGERLVVAREYRGISPVIKHTKEGRVLAILRASLVNRPNLKGLTTLHQETKMDLLAKLIGKLGLPTETSEDALVAAVETLHQAKTEGGVALQAQLAPIAKAAGLDENADAAAVLGAIESLKTATGDDKTVAALQSELTAVATKLQAVETATARANATAFVDLAIREKRVGVTPLRDHYISRHMKDPESVEKEIAALPMLNGTHTSLLPPKGKEGAAGLTAEESKVVAMMGIDPEAFAKAKAALGEIEAAA